MTFASMPLSPASVHGPALRWRLLAIGTAVAAIVVPAAGLFVFGPRAESRARADLVETLNTRAEIGAATVSRWADDALRDARLAASYPSAIELLRAAEPPHTTESHLIEALQPFVGIKGYGQVLIVRDGQVVARAANRSTSPACIVFPAAGRATAVGLHRHEDGSTWVTFAARIGVPLAGHPAVLLEQPATDYLFGLLSRSPVPFQSAESNLLGRDGEGFSVLSPLKFGADPRAAATIPAGSAMARALRGGNEQRREAAADYRGVETFIAGHAGRRHAVARHPESGRVRGVGCAASDDSNHHRRVERRGLVGGARGGRGPPLAAAAARCRGAHGNNNEPARSSITPAIRSSFSRPKDVWCMPTGAPTSSTATPPAVCSGAASSTISCRPTTGRRFGRGSPPRPRRARSWPRRTIAALTDRSPPSR